MSNAKINGLEPDAVYLDEYVEPPRIPILERYQSVGEKGIKVLRFLEAFWQMQPKAVFNHFEMFDYGWLPVRAYMVGQMTWDDLMTALTLLPAGRLDNLQQLELKAGLRKLMKEPGIL